MSYVPRIIVGPQSRYERTGAEGFRDVRPFITRLSENLRGQASGLVLSLLAGITYVVPPVATPVALIGTLFACWVLTQRVILPIRLPRSADCLDWNYPDPSTRKPRRAAGSIYIGTDQVTRQQLWITNEDGRQHATIPGTTGAGKTTAVVSFLINALAHGSGFVLVDGKASNELYADILAAARRLGREDDVRVLNFLTASLATPLAGEAVPLSQTHTFNPFSSGNADAIREMLVSQLGDVVASDANGVFRARAVALLGIITPVLVWMRDNKGISISIEQIRLSLELRSIWTLAKLSRFVVRDPGETKNSVVPVNNMPGDLVYPLLTYLGDLPGYDIDLPYNEQKEQKPSEQHGYALLYFLSTFTQLTVSLGHIFKVDSGDIDMRDIVLNRRILIVNLPALENSDDSLAALGKIIVASLRGMMAQLLGARLEGDPDEIFIAKPGMGQGPFHVVFDEMAYYATSGMDRMLAMGRGLNVMFWLGFQEVGGIVARLGQKTYSLLGNANLTIAMRQQDSNLTREWLEKTAGQTYVTQATSYHGSMDGQYRETQSAELRQVSRIDWQDLQKMQEGEAIVMMGGRVIHAKLFHAQLPSGGPTRLNRPLHLAAPSPADLAEFARIDDIRRHILSGQKTVQPARPLPPCPILEGFWDGFCAANEAQRSADFDVWINAGLRAIEGQVEAELMRAQAEDALAGGKPADPDEVSTEFDAMLGRPRSSAVAPSPPQPPHDPVSQRKADLHSSIAMTAGLDRDAAREAARAAMGQHDAMAAAIRWPEPPPMSAEVFGAHVRKLNEGLRTALIRAPGNDMAPE